MSTPCRPQSEECSNLGAAAELMQARVAAARSLFGTPASSASPFSRTRASTPLSSHHLPPSSPLGGADVGAGAAAAAADITAASMAAFMQQQAANLQQLAAGEVALQHSSPNPWTCIVGYPERPCTVCAIALVL